MEKPKNNLTQINNLNLKEKINSLTKYIGQVMLLNAWHSKDLGLLQGNMGSAVYLYNLYKFEENVYFHNFANELITKINDKIGLTDSFYVSGSTGIAWGISYLCKNEFIESDEVEDLLNNFDDFCLTKTTDYHLNIDFYGICSYLLSRVNEKKKIGNNNFRLLLIQERVVAQLDLMTNPIFSDNYLSNEILNHIANNKLNSQYLTTEINKICNSVIILNRAQAANIYIEVVNRAGKILHQKISNYLDVLSEIFLKTQNNESSYLYFRVICRLYYSQLVLVCPLKAKKKFDFESFFQLKSKQFMVPDAASLATYEEIQFYTTLFRLNKMQKNSDFNQFVHQQMASLVDHLYDKHQLEKMIYPNKFPLNLGLSGVAGLGMILLHYLMPEIADWDESLLIS